MSALSRASDGIVWHWALAISDPFDSDSSVAVAVGLRATIERDSMSDSLE